jgi:hypothetical protein
VFRLNAGEPVPAVSTGQMREVDRSMTEDFGIDLAQMTENAGPNPADLGQALVAPRVVVGTILHFAFAAFLGVAFAAVIGAAAWARVPGMRSPGGIISAGVIGGAIVYVIMRWGLLPATNPLMAFVPQIAFFLAHLLFGLVVGIVLAIAFRRPAVARAFPASR